MPAAPASVTWQRSMKPISLQLPMRRRQLPLLTFPYTSLSEVWKRALHRSTMLLQAPQRCCAQGPLGRSPVNPQLRHQAYRQSDGRKGHSLQGVRSVDYTKQTNKGDGSRSMMVSHRAQAAGPRQCEEPTVAIFTTTGCPYCRKAKGIFQEEGIAYEEVDVSSDARLRQELEGVTGQKSVPQIFFGGKLIGGADDLVSLKSKGKLSDVLAQHEGVEELPQLLMSAVTEAASEQQGASRAYAPAGTPIEEYRALKRLSDSLREDHLRDSAAGSRTFSLKAFETWYDEAAIDQGSAEELARKLLRAQILTVVDGSESNSWAGPAAAQKVLRFVADAPAPKLGQPLNAHFCWFGKPRPALEVAEQLRQSVLALYDKHLAADGKAVDYEGLSADSDFRLFVDATTELQKLDMSAFSREERLAFWINIYNILVVHALVVFGPASNIIARLGWFSSIKYRIGGQEYSANDIEHGVLRNNKPSPANLLSLIGLSGYAPKTFQPGDPRLSQAVDPEDPRIHFALVCGAKSCPPIKVYTPDTLEEGLASAAAAFVEGEVQVVPAERRLVMNKIFQWYGSDFGSKADILALLLRYLSGDARNDLVSLVEDMDSIQFSYKEYDWSQNSS